MKTCCQTAQSAGPPAQLQEGGVGPLSVPEPDEDPEPEPELEPEEEPDEDPEPEPELEPEEEPDEDPELEPELEPEEEPELDPELEPDEPDPEELAPASAPGDPRAGSGNPEQACMAATAHAVANPASDHPFRMKFSGVGRAPDVSKET